MNLIKKTVAILFVFCTLMMSAQLQTDYYVSGDTGSDLNSGISWKHPFKTIDRAINAIGRKTNDGRTYNIYISEGDYQISNQLPLNDRVFEGDKQINFYGGYPSPEANTISDLVCEQAPVLYPVSFNYSSGDSAFRIGKPSGEPEVNSTDLHFEGINYSSTSTNGGVADGTFVTLDRTARYATLSMKNMVISGYKSAPAGFIYFYGTENCNFIADKIFVTGGIRDGITGGSFFRAFGGSPDNKNMTVDVQNSSFVGNEIGSTVITFTNTLNATLFEIDTRNIDDNNVVILKNNNFCENELKYLEGKGAILKAYNTKLVIQGNTFNKNKGRNGIIHLYECEFIEPVTNNIWLDNTATSSDILRVVNHRNDVMMQGNKYMNNISSGNRGALFVSGSNITIDGDVYKGNKANYTGGAINIQGSNTTTIKNSTFCDNAVNSTLLGFGGAVHLSGTGTAKFENNLFKNNKAGDQGGAIYSTKPLESLNDQFYENSAKDGGAIFGYQADSYIKVTNGQFVSNTANGLVSSAKGVGGAIRATGNIDIINSIFKENTATNLGGAIWAGRILKDLGGKYIQNTSVNKGGAIFATNSFPATFAKGTDKGLFFNNLSKEGGAIYKEEGNILTVSQFVYKLNKATSNSTLNRGGGAVTAVGTNYQSSNNIYDSNKSQADAGAVLLKSGAKADFVNDIFTNNITTKNGGAIFANISELNTNRTKFSRNEATSGEGGAIHAASGTPLKVENSVFFENSADKGGAIKVQAKSIATNSKFLNNTASQGAAIFAYDQGLAGEGDSFTFSNSSSYGNGNGNEFFHYLVKIIINNSSVQLQPNGSNYPTGSYFNGFKLEGTNTLSNASTITPPVLIPTSPSYNLAPAKVCPPTITQNCLTIEDVLEPAALITTSEGTVDNPVTYTEICADEVPNTSVTLFGISGFKEFEITYHLVTIDGNNETTSSPITVNTTNGAYTVSLPNNTIPALGLKYKYEILSIKDSRGQVTTYDCTPKSSATINVLSCIDSDGDGIIDTIDLDDDNDGILDTDENAACTVDELEANTGLTVTGSDFTWETVSPLSNAIDRNADGSSNVSTLAKLTSDMNGASIDGKVIVEVTLNQPTYIKNIKFNLGANGGLTGAPAHKVVLEGFDGNNWFELSEIGPANSSLSSTYQNIYEKNKLFTKVRLKGVQGNLFVGGAHTLDAGGDIVDIRITPFPYFSTSCTAVDTDGDGIPDYLDLDSDNDGCPDALEGNGGFTYDNLVTAGGLLKGGNGVDPMTGPASGSYNQTILLNLGNTVDSNGIPTIANGGQINVSAYDHTVKSIACGPCTADPNTTGPGLETKHGITTLQRAGQNTGVSNPNDWPMVRKGAWTALESKSKGFVITRMSTIQIDTLNPQEGMMVYDTDQKCLKIYNGTKWSCFNEPGCPTP